VRHNPYGEDAVNLAADLANRRPASADDLSDRCRAQAALNAWEGIVEAAGEQDRADLLICITGTQNSRSVPYCSRCSRSVPHCIWWAGACNGRGAAR
jgi:hypothetical protein